MNLPQHVEVAIVGGGPVGLTLGCLLTLRGIDCVVLEEREEPAPYSRAIGIHPPGLAVLASVGLENELREQGIGITAGQVFYGAKQLGRLSLDTGQRYPFVLSLPQTETERLLEMRLNELAPNTLRRGVAVTACELHDETGGTLTVRRGEKDSVTLKARYVVACDGKKSAIRTALGIPFRGGKYPDCYLMGDFADNTPFGTDAALFLAKDGIVESFPLPGGFRRWVARLSERATHTDASTLATVVAERTGFFPDSETCRWTSAFGIEHFVAATVYLNSCFLAGDAAHVVSPIGGQGMNLGFMDAADLANRLPVMLAREKGIEIADNRHQVLRKVAARYEYDCRCLRAAQTAVGRAEFNTRLGRPCPPWHPHRALVSAILSVPTLSQKFARIFTMQDIR